MASGTALTADTTDCYRHRVWDAWNSTGSCRTLGRSTRRHVGRAVADASGAVLRASRLLEPRPDRFESCRGHYAFLQVSAEFRACVGSRPDGWSVFGR